MNEVLAAILDLQPDWTHVNNEEMDLRGDLIRHDGPMWLRERATALADAIGIPLSDFGVEGRDGTGRKTEIPWFRFYSVSRSPSATIGWYCVYLFDTEGDRAYLTVGHGSTDWTGGEFKPRPEGDLHRMADWAREKLAGLAAERTDLSQVISLKARRSDLGPAYEAGTVLAIGYDRGKIPHSDELERDALFMAQMLGEIYRAADTEAIPGLPPPEVVELLEVTDKAAGKVPKGGQGFRLSTKQRRAVEMRAVKLAIEHMKSAGWQRVQDVGDTKSYDLHCTTGTHVLKVEVKGTTSSGESIILTKNEVALHQNEYPNNALVVVTGITLSGTPEEPIADGGFLAVVSPWALDQERLTAISYLYTLSE